MLSPSDKQAMQVIAEALYLARAMGCAEDDVVLTLMDGNAVAAYTFAETRAMGREIVQRMQIARLDFPADLDPR